MTLFAELFGGVFFPSHPHMSGPQVYLASGGAHVGVIQNDTPLNEPYEAPQNVSQGVFLNDTPQNVPFEAFQNESCVFSQNETPRNALTVFSTTGDQGGGDMTPVNPGPLPFYLDPEDPSSGNKVSSRPCTLPTIVYCAEPASRTLENYCLQLASPCTKEGSPPPEHKGKFSLESQPMLWFCMKMMNLPSIPDF